VAKSLVTNFEAFAKHFDGVGEHPNLLEDVVGPVPADSTWMVLGLDICNVTNTGVTVDVVFYKDPTHSYYLCKNTPVPAGSTLPIIIHQKHVLTEGMKLQINCDTDNGVDVIGSYMDTYISNT
jgi:hypothetical protein